MKRSRSESKYFNTACLMDEALIALLAKKELEYITVKEICEKAGVHRSTFYLHYETMGDLLEESVAYVADNFREYMEKETARFPGGISELPKEELNLVTPRYLIPYLEYVKKNATLFRTAMKNPVTFRLEKTYAKMFSEIFEPVMARLDVPSHDRRFVVAYHLNGLIAIVREWLKGECAEPVEYIASLMRRCSTGGDASRN